jgi:rod shape-determining protein MreD
MRWLRYFLVLLTLVVLQTTVFPDLRVFGAVPDLLLVATIAVGYERGPDAGAVFGFVGGLAVDCFLSSSFGVSALAFALVGYGVGVFQSGLLRSSRFIAPVLGGIGGLVGGALWVVIAAVAGKNDLITGYSARIVVIAAVYDALLALLIFPFVHWACGNHDLARR